MDSFFSAKSDATVCFFFIECLVIKGEKGVLGEISDILLYNSAVWRDMSLSILTDSSWLC